MPRTNLDGFCGAVAVLAVSDGAFSNLVLVQWVGKVQTLANQNHIRKHWAICIQFIGQFIHIHHSVSKCVEIQIFGEKQRF